MVVLTKCSRNFIRKLARTPHYTGQMTVMEHHNICIIPFVVTMHGPILKYMLYTDHAHTQEHDRRAIKS